MTSESYLDVNAEIYDKPLPHISLPQVVGEFTEDIDGKINPGRKDAPYLHMTYLLPKKLKIHLNKGFNEKEFQELEVKLRKKESTSFLEWLGTYSKGDTVKEKCHCADIVAYRGILCSIATTPYIYHKRRTWKFVAKRDRESNVIFLGYKETDDRAQWCENAQTDLLERQYAGLKFEQYVTSKQNHLPNPIAPVVDKDKFLSVVKMNIGKDERNFGVLYLAEVDCIDPYDDKYVELKVHPKSFQFNLWPATVFWFMQSFLSATEKFVVGFRGLQNTTIKKYGRIKLQQLEEDQEKFRRNVTPWKKAVCFNFLESVLVKLCGHMTKTDVVLSDVEFKISEGRVVFRNCEENEAVSLTESLKTHLGVEKGISMTTCYNVTLSNSSTIDIFVGYLRTNADLEYQQ